MDVYALVSADSLTAAGWICSNNYNHEYVKTNGKPASIYNAQVTVSGFRDGAYYVKWYNCLTGNIILGAPAFAANNQLLIDIPKLDWDLAFRVDEEYSNVAIDKAGENTEFNVYPNPVSAGQMVNVHMKSSPGVPQFTLLDMAGRPLLELTAPGASAENAEIRLPGSLTAGVYWLRLDRGESSAVQAIVIK
ncbi:MAG: T9SS type A sorting domain-containing protein [Bacteroidia bacterium]